jgi:hydrogenase/urease accessory protein HupE
MPSLILPFLFTYFIFPSPLEAHILSASTSTFSAGFAHPFSGIDHLMAICATGLWAGQRGKFISMISLIIVIGSMFLGAMIGITGINLAIVDWGIGLSLFVLGTLLFFRHRTPLPRHSIFFLCCLIGCFFCFSRLFPWVSLASRYKQLVFIFDWFSNINGCHFFNE